MSKKISLAIGAIALAGLLIAGYLVFLEPKGTEGEKAVTIEIIIEREDISETYEYNTDHEFMVDLLMEEEELQVEGEDGEWGFFISGMLGVEADPNSEFYSIQENGTDTTVGVSELPVTDGSTYTFSLITW